MTTIRAVEHSMYVRDVTARAVLFLAILYSLSLVGHLGYFVTKDNGDWGLLRFFFMGFAKPLFLGVLLLVFCAIYPVLLRQLRWTWLFALVPLCLVLVELSHSWRLGEPYWHLMKRVMYVKYINTSISLALLFALFEFSLIAGLFDRRTLKAIAIMIAVTLIADLLLKFVGGPNLSIELYQMVAWNNALAYESAVALWILLAYHDKLDRKNSVRCVLIFLLGTAGLLLGSRGAILLTVSLLLFHVYPSWCGQTAMDKAEKLVAYALLVLNIYMIADHYLYFARYFNFDAAQLAVSQFRLGGMGGENQTLSQFRLGGMGGENQTLLISESDEVVSVVGRFEGGMAALRVFKEHILLGAGAEAVYKIDFHGIGIHSLWPLLLAAAGLAGTLPAIMLLGRYFYGAFKWGAGRAVIITMIFLFFGLNLINLFPWWYALILILCVHSFSRERTELSAFVMER